MNFYFLVEGRRTEKRVYRSWMQLFFPQMMEVGAVDQIKQDNYLIVVGDGYPSYTKRIPASLTDISDCGSIDHFFICIDTENESPESKQSEIATLLQSGPLFANSHIVIQHCCLETWFLGHTRMLKRNPQSETLRRYKKFYDISKNDPEGMDCPSDFDVRAQFHYDYLKEMLREQHLSYSKQFPGCVAERHYFHALQARHELTGHISSFGNLVILWSSLGASFDPPIPPVPSNPEFAACCKGLPAMVYPKVNPPRISDPGGWYLLRHIHA